MTTENPHIIPQIDTTDGIEFGLYTLGDHMTNPHTGKRISAKQRLQEIVEMAVLAEEAGMDIFQVGESHQEYFATQAHMVVLSAIAQATQTIKIASSSTIISTADPVRVFEDAATIDLLSDGRMEIVAGRASRLGLFDLFGYRMEDYERLFDEKFELLLQINENESVTWEGEFRPPLKDAHVLPRPENEAKGLPIWRAVGGAPGSAVHAGLAGVPMYMAHLGGPAEVFKRTIDTYRNYAEYKGFDVEKLPIATAGMFFVNENRQEAYRQAYPYINEGHKLSNGQGVSKRAFAQGMDPKSVLNVGDPELIIEKILYQHEMFGHQRYVAQLDFGGVPLEEIKYQIDLIGNTILPAVKKHTAKKD